MEKAKKRVRICLLLVVMVAVVMGILYYYHDLGDTRIKQEGTLISGTCGWWNDLWR